MQLPYRSALDSSKLFPHQHSTPHWSPAYVNPLLWHESPHFSMVMAGSVNFFGNRRLFNTSAAHPTGSQYGTVFFMNPTWSALRIPGTFLPHVPSLTGVARSGPLVIGLHPGSEGNHPLVFSLSLLGFTQSFMSSLLWSSKSAAQSSMTPLFCVHFVNARSSAV